MKESTQIDQTRFATEEPLLEKPLVVESAVPAGEKPPLPSKKSKLKLALIGVGLFIVLFAIILMIIRFLMPADQRPSTQELEEVEQGAVVKTELERRVEEVRDELRAADPAKQDLPFPPVNMEIRLDDK